MSAIVDADVDMFPGRVVEGQAITISVAALRLPPAIVVTEQTAYGARQRGGEQSVRDGTVASPAGGLPTNATLGHWWMKWIAEPLPPLPLLPYRTPAHGVPPLPGGCSRP